MMSSRYRRMTRMSKHLTAFEARHLTAGESILAWGEGYIGKMMGRGRETQHNGVLIVTDRRVAFCRRGWLGDVLETIPLRSIGSIERLSVLGHRTMRMHTSHDALEFKMFDRTAESALAQAIEQCREPI